MDCIMPGFPVHHQLLELTQTHVHWVGDAIQPSHPLSSPSLSAFSLSQHQGLFQWFSSSQQVAKVSASASVLPMNIQDWFPLEFTGFISLQSKGLSRVFSNTTCQKHQFFSAQPSSPVRTGHGTKDWFQIGKGVCQGCILSSCLFNLNADTSWETLGWMKHKLESRLPGEISIASDIQMTPPLWQKVKSN